MIKKKTNSQNHNVNMPNILIFQKTNTSEIVLWRGHFVAEGTMVSMSSSNT